MFGWLTSIPLHTATAMAVVLAFIAGHLTGPQAIILNIHVNEIYQITGKIFLNALKMVTVPLIFSSMIVGVSRVGSQSRLGILGSRTLVYYLLTSLVAVFTGVVLVNIMKPGISGGAAAGQLLGIGSIPADTLANLERSGDTGLSSIFFRMIPPNIISAAAQGQLLGLIFFAILVGSAINIHRNNPNVEVFSNFWDGLFEIMMQVTQWIMKFAPLGIFGLVASTVASTGFSALGPIITFCVTVISGLLVHSFITLPVILILAGNNPVSHFRNILPALVTAFSTSSSSATLPVTLECLEENLNIPNRISSFTVSLGATVNMDGTALYECVTVLFLAQAYGIDLSLAQQFSIMIAALFTSVGVAGVPSASLVAITLIMSSIGLPVEAMAPVMLVDRILDMCRTSVNVLSDTCGAAVISRLEGE